MVDDFILEAHNTVDSFLEGLDFFVCFLKPVY